MSNIAHGRAWMLRTNALNRSRPSANCSGCARNCRDINSYQGSKRRRRPRRGRVSDFVLSLASALSRLSPALMSSEPELRFRDFSWASISAGRFSVRDHRFARHSPQLVVATFLAHIVRSSILETCLQARLTRDEAHGSPPTSPTYRSSSQRADPSGTVNPRPPDGAKVPRVC